MAAEAGRDVAAGGGGAEEEDGREEKEGAAGDAATEPAPRLEGSRTAAADEGCWAWNKCDKRNR